MNKFIDHKLMTSEKKEKVQLTWIIPARTELTGGAYLILTPKQTFSSLIHSELLLSRTLKNLLKKLYLVLNR